MRDPLRYSCPCLAIDCQQWRRWVLPSCWVRRHGRLSGGSGRKPSGNKICTPTVALSRRRPKLTGSTRRSNGASLSTLKRLGAMRA